MTATRPLRSFADPDDLLVLLAVARSGTVTGAATQLDIDHSTVSRRIARLERHAGQRLFDRSARGWQLTESGGRLREYAEQLQRTLDSAARAMSNRSADGICGSVRLLTPDGFGTYLAPRALASVVTRHPALRIEILTSTRHLDLNAGEYDIAIALEATPSRAVIARPLCTYSLGLFASSDYLADRAPIDTVQNLCNESLVYYLDDHLDIDALRVLERIAPGKNATFQSNSVAAQAHSVLAGHGVGLLPSYVAQFHPDLVPVLPDTVVIQQKYWIVIPSAVQRAPHIQVAAQHLVANLSGHLDDPFRPWPPVSSPIDENRNAALQPQLPTGPSFERDLS